MAKFHEYHYKEFLQLSDMEMWFSSWANKFGYEIINVFVSKTKNSYVVVYDTWNVD